MLSNLGDRPRRQALWCSLTASGWATMVAVFTALCAWMIDPAAAQRPAAQSYRIGAGDKIGVVVLGQPDLSGESTVDQRGNLRLPMVGDIHAVDLTLSELEKSIGQSLEQGYVRRPVVSARVAEFRPVYVLGIVRRPGLYPYQQGQSVLAAIARAGGIGTSEQGGSMGGELIQADERVRLLEISRATLLARRARLIAQLDGNERVKFPEMSGLPVEPARLIHIREAEQRAFEAERQAEQQETEALQKQIPRLEAEIASLRQQAELELRQRALNQQLIADYERLNSSGLARKQTYIEVKREEARIDGNIERLKSQELRAELGIGDVQFRIAELRNTYRRRVMIELRETDRSLADLSVTLPAAQRLRAARAREVGWLTAEQAQQTPPITVIRAKSMTSVKYDAAVEFLLEPGDLVQVGPLLPSDLTPDTSGPSERRGGEQASTAEGRR